MSGSRLPRGLFALRAPDRRCARSLGRVLVVALAVAMVAASGAVASPAPSSVSVADLGQPMLMSSVPQPPVDAAARGVCAVPLDGAQANGTPSPCGSDAWPVLGGSWGPELQVAGGDTVQLTFDQPVGDVRVASTTDFPVGLTDPDGHPVPNDELMAPQTAQSTGDPSVWTAVLPVTADRRQRTFSIVAGDGTVDANFALALQAPRYDNTATRCGTYFLAPGVTGTECDSAGIKGPPPGLGLTKAGPPIIPTTGVTPSAEASSPASVMLRLGARLVLRGRRASFGVWVNRRGTLTVRLVAPHGKTLATGRRRLRAGHATVSIKLGADALAAMKASRARVHVIASFGDGRRVAKRSAALGTVQGH